MDWRAKEKIEVKIFYFDFFLAEIDEAKSLARQGFQDLDEKFSMTYLGWRGNKTLRAPAPFWQGAFREGSRNNAVYSELLKRGDNGCGFLSMQMLVLWCSKRKLSGSFGDGYTSLSRL